MPLRLRPGKDNNIEGHISQKGIVVTGTGEEQIIKAGKEKHTWLEVKVPGSAIGNNAADGVYNFGPVSIFWTIACLIAFVLPVIGWKYLRVRE